MKPPFHGVWMTSNRRFMAFEQTAIHAFAILAVKA
jgi:hypothetical protein